MSNLCARTHVARARVPATLGRLPTSYHPPRASGHRLRRTALLFKNTVFTTKYCRRRRFIPVKRLAKGRALNILNREDQNFRTFIRSRSPSSYSSRGSCTAELKLLGGLQIRALQECRLFCDASPTPLCLYHWRPCAPVDIPFTFLTRPPKRSSHPRPAYVSTSLLVSHHQQMQDYLCVGEQVMRSGHCRMRRQGGALSDAATDQHHINCLSHRPRRVIAPVLFQAPPPSIDPLWILYQRRPR